MAVGRHREMCQWDEMRPCPMQHPLGSGAEQKVYGCSERDRRCKISAKWTGGGDEYT